MRISVALCTYNGERFLQKQLASIAAQSQLPYELVVCDDGSIDSTMRLVKEFSISVPFDVRIFNNSPRLGVTKNFELAIGLCRGDIIVLSDQDDVWLPEKLEKISRKFESNSNVGMVFSDAERVDESLQILSERLWDVVGFSVNERRIAAQGRILEVLLRHFTVTGATMAFHSNLRSLVLPIPNGWMHDGWIALLSSCCTEVDFINEPLIFYRQHEFNQIGARRKGLRERWNEAISLQRKIYYGEEIQRYRDAYSRLSYILQRSDRGGILELMERKLQFLVKRSQMPSNRLLRIPHIAWQLFRGNYYKFSYGWQVAVKDFIIPGHRFDTRI